MTASDKSPEEKYQTFRRIYSATYEGNRNPKSVTQACKDEGISTNSYYRWKQLLEQNPQYDRDQIIPEKSKAPKSNRAKLPDSTYQLMIAMAQSNRYENPNQIAKAMVNQGTKVSANAVRNYLENQGYYGYEQVLGSNGKKTKKRVLRSTPKTP